MKSKGKFKKRVVDKWEKKTGMKFLDAHSHIPLSMFLEVVDEARKTLLTCKDYESLRKEVVRWFGK